jgi:HSP20 family protein
VGGGHHAEEETMANRGLQHWTPARSGMMPFGRDPFGSFRREMDRLFDDFFAPVEGREHGTFLAGGNWPSLDVDETDQAYKITAELPGLSLKDVNVDLRDNVLTISGEKREEHKEEKSGRHYSERSYGRFERVIPFNVEVDADKVQASFKAGVLTIELPKSAKAKDKSRHIDIKAQ